MRSWQSFRTVEREVKQFLNYLYGKEGRCLMMCCLMNVDKVALPSRQMFCSSDEALSVKQFTHKQPVSIVHFGREQNKKFVCTGVYGEVKIIDFHFGDVKSL